MSVQEQRMLTGKMVCVRFAKDRIIPRYLDVDDPTWREVADRLLELFHGRANRTRGELEDDLSETFGDAPGQIVHQGLAKLLEDRCEFEVVSGRPPDEIRSAVFAVAAEARSGSANEFDRFDRAAILQRVASDLGLTPEAIDQSLFADLKSEQRLASFKDISPQRLLERYNVALVQAVLLRAVQVTIVVRGEPPQRYRQLLRRVKFHRLVCEMEALGADTIRLRLDGPLSLFTATQKYGLQLALFLPAVLLCRAFELKAEIRWGPQRKPKTLLVTNKDGLVSHLSDSDSYVPPEMQMFVELFRKQIEDWELVQESSIVALKDGYWLPDFRLVHRPSGQTVLLEVLGFWRRSNVERHLARLRGQTNEPFLLAVSDQLRVEDGELADIPAGVHRFRSMPLPEEIARLAAAVLGQEA
jgi:predicted nuclease of restriction endonuclease-like RecB superfamily